MACPIAKNPTSAAITSWHGVDGAVAAAKSGHDSVLSPAPTLYFDNRQAFSTLEPPGRGNLVTLQTVYSFNPTPLQLSKAEQRHILGLQGNLWTEHVRTEERAEWNAFPRAIAVAEIGWSHRSPPDFAGFIDRLVPQLQRMRALGLKPAVSAFAVNADTQYAPPARSATIALSSQSGLPIRYSNYWYILEGKAPLAFGMGIHGQNLFVDGRNEIVIAKFSSQAIPLDAARMADIRMSHR